MDGYPKEWIMRLSVAMITKNEENNLRRTLESVKSFADEIVIVDSGSTDRTEEIAKEFGAKFYSEPWKGYGEQRNSVIDKAQGEWILNIDADEEISPQLQKKIVEIKEKEREKSVFKINFTSVCFGKKIKHGGWSNSYHIRLFKKEAGRFNSNTVHEEFCTQERIYTLKEDIYHHSYSNLRDYFTKFNRYTTEGALEYYKRGKKSNIFQLAINPIFKFLRMYIFRLGFLDGKEGFLLACTSSLYTMVKYYKLYEIDKNKSYIEE